MFSLDHIRTLRAKARKLGLYAHPSFWTATDEALQASYNGIGSDKFKVLLGITTEIFELFEPAALIHDWDWGPCNFGVDSSWHEANERFRHNCYILAMASKIWFGIFRPQIRVMRCWWGNRLADVVSSKIGREIYHGNAGASNKDVQKPNLSVLS